MIAKIVLDPSGENKICSGFTCVETEVEFLRNDCTAEQLWVRGQNLCRWAEDLYRVRGLKEGVDFQTLRSPRELLRSLIGEAAEDLSPEVVSRSADLLGAEPRLGLGHLIAGLTSEEFWIESPSRTHAAKWLLVKVDDELLPLIQVRRRQWAQACSDDFLLQLYEVPIDERIEQVRTWLCADADSRFGLFPLYAEGKVAEVLEEEWGRRLRETQGSAVDNLLLKNPNAVHIAEVAHEYFYEHSIHLTQSRLARVARFLSPSKRTDLEERIPRQRPQPIAFGASPQEVLAWSVEQYLPYRQWQVTLDEKDPIEEIAGSFVDWLLNNYPRLTVCSREESLLNIRGRFIVEELAKNRPVLWVVVDGLNYANHQQLLRHLGSTEACLKIEQNLKLFAVLPTVTKRAKYGLTTGCFPRENAKGGWDIKRIFRTTFPEGKYVGRTQIGRLRTALAGETAAFCYWNMTAVDDCYHEQTDLAAIKHNVRGQIKTLAENISDLVMKSPLRDQIAVVVSTDHGQMLGHCVRLNVPLGNMQAHGRIAYGGMLGADRTQDEPYAKAVDGSMVQLNPISFQLDQEVTIALQRYCFSSWATDDYGRAWGVHGGLFPEEVVVGFAVLSRQPERKLVSAKISGVGEVGTPGSLHIEVDNPNKVRLNNFQMSVNEIPQLQNGICIPGEALAVAVTNLQVEVQSWPPPTDGYKLDVTGTLHFEYDDGTCEECEVSGTLTCRRMYTKKGPSLRDKFGRE